MQGRPAEITIRTAVPAVRVLPGAGLRLRTPPLGTVVLAAEPTLPTVQCAARMFCSTLVRVAPDRNLGTTHGGGGAAMVVCALVAASGADSLSGYSKYAQMRYVPVLVNVSLVFSVKGPPVTFHAPRTVVAPAARAAAAAFAAHGSPV